MIIEDPVYPEGTNSNQKDQDSIVDPYDPSNDNEEPDVSIDNGGQLVSDPTGNNGNNGNNVNGYPDGSIEDPKDNGGQIVNDPTGNNNGNNGNGYGPIDDNTIQPTPNSNGYVPQCGQRHKNGIGVRIAHTSTNDTSTQFGEWPHQCAILNKTEIAGTEHNLYVCGGSLIAPNVVLTAAHCVE